MRALTPFLTIAVAACVLMEAPVAGAQTTTVGAYGIAEVKGGLLAHDVPDLWSGFSLERRAIDVNMEMLFSGVRFLGGTLAPAIGGTVNTRGDTSHAYLDARWQLELPYNLFLGTGVGVAVHDGLIDPVANDKKALGSRALFHIPLELGVRLDARNSVSVYFEHTSNAGVANYNEGMDRLGIRYGYRF